jgi:hypothetical protein
MEIKGLRLYMGVTRKAVLTSDAVNKTRGGVASQTIRGRRACLGNFAKLLLDASKDYNTSHRRPLVVLQCQV